MKLLAKSTFPLSWVPEVFLACGEEFSVLAEGRHIFDRRPKPWQKPETALEESLAPRVHFPQSSHKWNKSQKVRCLIKLRCCLAHKIIFNNNSDVIYQNIKQGTGTTRHHFELLYIYNFFVTGRGGWGKFGCSKVPMSDLKRVKVYLYLYIVVWAAGKSVSPWHLPLSPSTILEVKEAFQLATKTLQVASDISCLRFRKRMIPSVNVTLRFLCLWMRWVYIC